MADPIAITSRKPFMGFKRQAPATPFSQGDLTRELKAIVENYAARETTRLIWRKTPARELRDALIAEVTRELAGRLGVEKATLSAVICKRAHLVAVQLDEVHVGALKWAETSWTAQVSPVDHGSPQAA